ncbi:MAG TPA: hypothetical protein VNA28_02895 [Solirubrobacteraceae bacterium]|nr:hypothetical protein [Solirubrobacteraceae bacterium]
MEPDDLYGLPLDQFIPQRTALTRALRADKRRDEATAVAARRKPSVAAWAVNQLVRSQGSSVGELYAAGDALREAQANLLDGSGDGRALRAASERERAAVDGLVEAARGLLNSDGHELSPSIVERVSDTLHAAALDEGAREQVRGGTLERELRHVGLGLGETPFVPAAAPAMAAPAAKPAPTRSKKPVANKQETKTQRTAREQAARERAEAAKRAERERTAAKKAARTAQTAARRRVERGEAALRAAQGRHERAAHALAEAEAALAAAETEAREAAAEHERARAAVAEL